MQNKVYVGNLAYGAGQEEISKFFSDFGQVKEVAVPTDRETGRPRGFAFVTFENDSQAMAAVQGANGKDFLGRALKVSIAKEREATGRGGR